MLTDEQRATEDIQDIVRCVAEASGVPMECVMSTKRTARFAEARHIGFYVARQRGFGLSEIGRAMGRDHSTVTHGIQNIERRLRVSPRFAEEIQNVINLAMAKVYAKKQTTEDQIVAVRLTAAEVMANIARDAALAIDRVSKVAEAEIARIAEAAKPMLG